MRDTDPSAGLAGAIDGCDVPDVVRHPSLAGSERDRLGVPADRRPLRHRIRRRIDAVDGAAVVLRRPDAAIGGAGHAADVRLEPDRGCDRVRDRIDPVDRGGTEVAYPHHARTECDRGRMDADGNRFDDAAMGRIHARDRSAAVVGRPERACAVRHCGRLCADVDCEGRHRDER